MPDTIALSESAVAVLRFRIKGLRVPIAERNLDAYRELATAGIMEPVPGADGKPEVDYRFTEEGWARRQAILDAAVAHLHSLEPRLPERIDLSQEAVATLKEYLAGDRSVTDANREAYRELARAGIMIPLSGFIGGPESSFLFTHQGWERREEWLTAARCEPNRPEKPSDVSAYRHVGFRGILRLKQDRGCRA